MRRTKGIRWGDEKAIEEFLETKADRITKLITKEQMVTGLQPIEEGDMIGDPMYKHGIQRFVWCNTNNGALYSVGEKVSKTDPMMWSDKYKKWNKYMSMVNGNVLLLQEAGRVSKQGIMERVGWTQGYVTKINARVRSNRLKGTGAGEGMLTQIAKNLAPKAPMYIEDELAHLQVTVILGGADKGSRQRGLAVVNIYVPAQDESKTMRQEERAKFCAMVGDMVDQLRQQDYHILMMGDLNTAMRAEDRNGPLRREDKRTTEMIKSWGLVDIWRAREAQWKINTKLDGLAHTWSKCNDDSRISSRIDYALCDPEFLRLYVKGIRMDSVNRIAGVDHKALMVDVSDRFWQSNVCTDEEAWVADPPGDHALPRISVLNWKKDDYQRFRDELDKLSEVPADKEVEWLFTTAQPRVLRKMSPRQQVGEWHCYSKCPEVATKWSYGSKMWKNDDSNTGRIRAVSISQLHTSNIGTIDLSKMDSNDKKKVTQAHKARNTEKQIVAVQAKDAIGVVISPRLDVHEAKAWAQMLPKHKKRTTPAQERIEHMFSQLVHKVRTAATVEKEEERQNRGRNARPFWNPVLTAAQRERELLTSMRRAYYKWKKHEHEEDWIEVEQRSLEWEIEWRVAKGELSSNIVRIRTRAAVPTITEEAMLKWRRIEKQNNMEPLVQLSEVQQSLMIPDSGKQLSFDLWDQQVELRIKELARITRADVRTALYEQKEERQTWDDAYIDGKVKGLVSKVLCKSQGAHSVDNVWLPHETGLRLSCKTSDIRSETERFFYEWMRSRAEPWGTQEQRRMRPAQFPNRLPDTLPDIPCYKEVSDELERLLHRVNEPGCEWRELHSQVGAPITREELRDYLSKVKKGTAPGISGIPVELWSNATDSIQDELLTLLNISLEEGIVPSQWNKRLIRLLAKTETATGLADVRPITLCEVTQKLLTGIITDRISAVWNEHAILHASQMAFLFGRGCYQAIERVRGLQMDVEHKNENGMETELHMLYLDLAKAYDSVEYWAMDDAMRGLGVPENILTLMRALDEEASAKVLTGGAAEETGWIGLGRGAPQGEVMSPLRFIAWINLLLEVLDATGGGYHFKGDAGNKRYVGQAFCDDGFFVSTDREGLQHLCDRISAFCEIYKVKINASKCDYQVSRGKQRNRQTVAAWNDPETTEGRQPLWLWDYTAGDGHGQWLPVAERNPAEAVRYLGVMLAADRNGRAQRTKVDKAVRKVLDRLQGTKCSGALACYIVRACVGGILNYHGPFTNLTTAMIQSWDRYIRSILRAKFGVHRCTRLGLLYDGNGKGLRWFSARSCINEVILTEAWVAMTSESIEGEMIREQVRVANRHKGTIYTPWGNPSKGASERLMWHSSVRMVEGVLADIGWTITSDIPAWGSEGMPPGRGPKDAALASIAPELTQHMIGGSTLLQDAQQHGIHWVSQLFDSSSNLIEKTGKEGLARRRWAAVLATLAEDVSEWSPWSPNTRCSLIEQAPREDEYVINPARCAFEGEALVAISDGSQRNGKASYATCGVQGIHGSSAGRIRGRQGIAKAELIGAWAQLKMAEPELRDGTKGFHGWLDNQGIYKKLNRAHRMTDRQIKRSHEPGLYWRQIRKWMRRYPGRITWHWLKSHTDRKGRLHEAHNVCDKVAGIIADEEQDVQAPLFVAGDWDFVILDEQGQKVEGDPRSSVKRRMNALLWEGIPESSRTMTNLQGLEDAAQKAFNTLMRADGDQYARKEWVATIRGRWGLMHDSRHEDQSCRVCPPCLDCTGRLEGEDSESEGEGYGSVEGEGCESCFETIQHAVHAGCNQALRQLRLANVKHLGGKARTLLLPQEWDRLTSAVRVLEIRGEIGHYIRRVSDTTSRVVHPVDPWFRNKPPGDFMVWKGQRWEIDIDAVEASHAPGQYPREGRMEAERVTYLSWMDGEHERERVKLPKDSWVTENAITRALIENEVTDPLDIATVLWNELPSMSDNVGPVTRDMAASLCALTAETARETLVWEHPLLWDPKVRSGALHDRWRSMGVSKTDIHECNTIQVVWREVTKDMVCGWDVRASNRGTDAMDIYVLPDGALPREGTKQRPMVGTPWVRLGTTGMATLTSKGEKLQTVGGVWFKGGARAWASLDWSAVSHMAEARGELQWQEGPPTGVPGPSMSEAIAYEIMGCHSKLLGLGGGVEQRILLQGSDRLLTEAQRVSVDPRPLMDLLQAGQRSIWHMKNGFKQAAHKEMEASDDDSGGEEEQRSNLLRVYGQDKTRGTLCLRAPPAQVQVWATKGRKLANRMVSAGKVQRSKDSLLGLPEAAEMGSSRVSAVVERKARMWADLVSRPDVGPPTRKRCQGVCGLCGNGASRWYDGLKLCSGCHTKAPDPVEGWLLEGLTWLCTLGETLWGAQVARQRLTTKKAAKRWRRWVLHEAQEAVGTEAEVWYEGLCRVLGTREVLMTEWEHVWADRSQQLADVMGAHWSCQQVGLARPSQVVLQLRSTAVWRPYAIVQAEAIRTQKEERRLEIQRRMAVEAARKRHNTLEKARRKELRDERERLERTAKEAASRARKAEADEAKRIAAAAKEAARQSSRAAKEAKEERKARAREAASAVVKTLNEEYEREMEARESRRTHAREAAMAVVHELNKEHAREMEAARRRSADRHKQPCTRSAPPKRKETEEIGWVQRMTGSGRVSKWLRELDEWTPVKSLVRRGRGSYLPQALRAGHLRWSAERTPPTTSPASDTPTSASIGSGDDTMPVGGPTFSLAVSLATGTRRRTRTREKCQTRPTTAKGTEQIDLLPERQARGTAATPRNRSGQEDFFHRKGWP